MPFRWDDERTLKFLSVYRKHKCLWNPYSPDYSNCSAKNDAFACIVRELNASGLTAKDCLKRVRSIREIYRREQLKTVQGLKSGRPYESKTPWYNQMARMLTEVICDEENSGTKRSRKDPSNEEPDDFNELNDFNASKESNEEIDRPDVDNLEAVKLLPDSNASPIFFHEKVFESSEEEPHGKSKRIKLRERNEPLKAISDFQFEPCSDASCILKHNKLSKRERTKRNRLKRPSATTGSDRKIDPCSHSLIIPKSGKVASKAKENEIKDSRAKLVKKKSTSKIAPSTVAQLISKDLQNQLPNMQTKDSGAANKKKNKDTLEYRLADHSRPQDDNTTVCVTSTSNYPEMSNHPGKFNRNTNAVPSSTCSDGYNRQSRLNHFQTNRVPCPYYAANNNYSGGSDGGKESGTTESYPHSEERNYSSRCDGNWQPKVVPCDHGSSFLHQNIQDNKYYEAKATPFPRYMENNDSSAGNGATPAPYSIGEADEYPNEYYSNWQTNCVRYPSGEGSPGQSKPFARVQNSFTPDRKESERFGRYRETGTDAKSCSENKWDNDKRIKTSPKDQRFIEFTPMVTTKYENGVFEAFSRFKVVVPDSSPGERHLVQPNHDERPNVKETESVCTTKLSCSKTRTNDLGTLSSPRRRQTVSTSMADLCRRESQYTETEMASKRSNQTAMEIIGVNKNIQNSICFQMKDGDSDEKGRWTNDFVLITPHGKYIPLVKEQGSYLEDLTNWCSPTGTQDEGEDPVDAVERELSCRKYSDSQIFPKSPSDVEKPRATKVLLDCVKKILDMDGKNRTKRPDATIQCSNDCGVSPNRRDNSQSPEGRTMDSDAQKGRPGQSKPISQRARKRVSLPMVDDSCEPCRNTQDNHAGSSVNRGQSKSSCESNGQRPAIVPMEIVSCEPCRNSQENYLVMRQSKSSTKSIRPKVRERVIPPMKDDSCEPCCKAHDSYLASPEMPGSKPNQRLLDAAATLEDVDSCEPCEEIMGEVLPGRLTETFLDVLKCTLTMDNDSGLKEKDNIARRGGNIKTAFSRQTSASTCPIARSEEDGSLVSNAMMNQIASCSAKMMRIDAGGELPENIQALLEDLYNIHGINLPVFKDNEDDKNDDIPASSTETASTSLQKSEASGTGESSDGSSMQGTPAALNEAFPSVISAETNSFVRPVPGVENNVDSVASADGANADLFADTPDLGPNDENLKVPSNGSNGKPVEIQDEDTPDYVMRSDGQRDVTLELSSMNPKDNSDVETTRDASDMQLLKHSTPLRDKEHRTPDLNVSSYCVDTVNTSIRSHELDGEDSLYPICVPATSDESNATATGTNTMISVTDAPEKGRHSETAREASSSTK